MNTTADAVYIGSQRCAQCHADQHATYLHTAHSRSMSHVQADRQPPDAAIEHAASGRRYRVHRQDGRLYHRESLPTADGSELVLGDHPLSYLVGSGRFARTYVVEDAGFLVESPLTWYESLEKWDMSPGYDRPNHRSFYRAVEYDCLFCHAGAARPVENNEHRVQLGELAISCERCHGPGSLHVARWSGNESGDAGPEGDRTIVHPGRLPRDLAEAICHQCHLTTEIQVAVRGRSAADFRPGLRWQQFVVNYDDQTASDGMTVVGHVAQLRHSRCYQASGQLTCITCHAGHVPVTPADRVTHHRANCQACHAEPSCNVAFPTRTAQNGNDCAACHMPQSPTDVPHVAFTHHRIGLHRPPDESPHVAARNKAPLVPVLDVSDLPALDRELALGLAYWQRFRNEGDDPEQADFDRARLLIESTAARGLIDPRQTLVLAELAATSGDMAAAERLALETIGGPAPPFKSRVSALRLLSGIAMQDDRHAAAAGYLEQLTKLARDPRDFVLLGVCRQRQGDVPGAIAAFERVLEIDPAQPETYELLAPLYESAGQAERAASSRRQGELIRAAANPREQTNHRPAPPR